jgi:hypothetical protein
VKKALAFARWLLASNAGKRVLFRRKRRAGSLTRCWLAGLQLTYSTPSCSAKPH